MKNIAVLNAIDLTPCAHEPVREGHSAFDLACAKALALPGVDRVVVLTRKKMKLPSKFKAVVRDDWSLRDLLLELGNQGAGAEAVLYLFGDCPLIDPALAARMWDNHRNFFADYSFADGYPYGLAVEILKTAAIDPLLALVKDGEPVNRDSLFEVLKRDINAFDLETEIAPVDLRQLRISLSADTRRNFMLLKNVIAEGARDAASVIALLQSQPELLRTLPAFFNLQIVEGCPQVCSYCPYPIFHKDMLGKKAELDVAACETILKQIVDFCGDAVISVSLWGEPSLHSKIYDLLELFHRQDGISVMVETSGIGWQSSALRALGRLDRTDWIVSLDTLDETTYKTLRGEGFGEALDFARLALELSPQRVHVQAVRMKENEGALEKFYREWKKTTEHVIIQKYDHFSGFLPDRKITDLSPLVRLPCWHNKRDVAILIDGTVPLCREDVTGTTVLGNILREPLAEIWKRGQAVYQSQVQGNYAGICRECDEYYTFNS